MIPPRPAGHPQTWPAPPAFPALRLPPRPWPRVPAVSLRPAAGLLGAAPGSESSRGPAPRGRLLSPPLGRSPQPACPAASSATSGGTGCPGCASFSAARGRRRERSRPLRPAGPLRASGRPLGAEASRELVPSGSARPAPPLKTRSLGWSTTCRARWRGRERRGQCSLLLTKGAGALPQRRGRRVPPASPPAAAALRAPRAACRGLRAGAGTAGRRARGCGGAGGAAAGLGAREAPPCRSGAAGPASNKWRRTPRAQPTPAEPRPRPAQRWGHRAAPRRRSARAVPFVYTLEDTQLRKHRRRHCRKWGCTGC